MKRSNPYPKPQLSKSSKAGDEVFYAHAGPMKVLTNGKVMRIRNVGDGTPGSGTPGEEFDMVKPMRRRG